MTFLLPMTNKHWGRRFWWLSMIWNTNTKPHISRLHSSVLIILNRTFLFPYFSVLYALSLTENTNMIQPKGLIPSYIMNRNVSRPPKVPSGSVEEESCRIWQRLSMRYNSRLSVAQVQTTFVFYEGGRDNTPPINHIHDFKSTKSIKILIILQIKTITCRENEDISLILWH